MATLPGRSSERALTQQDSELERLRALSFQLYEALAQGWPRRPHLGPRTKDAAARRELALDALRAFEAYEHAGEIAETIAAARHEEKQREEQLQRQQGGRKVALCGTPSGYQRHWRRGEPACASCLAAHRTAARHLRLN